MNPAPISDAVQRYVEDVGVFMESTGVPRAAGRLMGWLLVCDPPEQSAQQLADALLASSGGISTNIRYLVQVGFVERVTFPADRRSYYRIRDDAWSATMVEQLRVIRTMRQFAEAGLALVRDGGGSDDRLTATRDFFAFMEREVPLLIERYESEYRPHPSD